MQVTLDAVEDGLGPNLSDNSAHYLSLPRRAQHNYPLHEKTTDLNLSLPNHAGNQDPTGSATPPRSGPDWVFYNAGVDVLAGGILGRLGLSLAGLRARDTAVFATTKRPAPRLMTGWS